MACKNCSVGSFAQAEGLKSVLSVQQAVIAIVRIKIYTPCSAGQYNSYSNQTECLRLYCRQISAK